MRHDLGTCLEELGAKGTRKRVDSATFENG